MTTFETQIQIMEQSIIDVLTELHNSKGVGYSIRKWQIQKETGIPQDVLTVLLRRLKFAGKVQLNVIWSEETCLPNGSGYSLQF